MENTVFYSWQSDRPSKNTQYFIENALKEAIKKVAESMAIEVAPRLDRDTKNVPGTPDVVKTIFEKVSKCAIFVADLTIVAKTPRGKNIPNPNVLIEFGYALGKIGSEKIIFVMNEAYGAAKEDLPFNINQRKWPIRYFLKVNDTPENYTLQRQHLISELEKAVKLIIQETNVFSSAEDIKSKWKSSSYLDDDDKLVRLSPLDDDDEEDPLDVYWHNKPQAFLRIIPNNVGKRWQAIELKEILEKNSPRLVPMGKDGDSWPVMNQHGAIAIPNRNYNKSVSIERFTQVFHNMEIWGINQACLKNRSNQRNRIRSLAIEKMFVFTLDSYLDFLKNNIEDATSFRFIAGLSDVSDYAITSKLNDTTGNCVEKEIIYKSPIEKLTKEPVELLLPFFKKI